MARKKKKKQVVESEVAPVIEAIDEPTEEAVAEVVVTEEPKVEEVAAPAVPLPPVEKPKSPDELEEEYYAQVKAKQEAERKADYEREHAHEIEAANREKKKMQNHYRETAKSLRGQAKQFEAKAEECLAQARELEAKLDAE